jgi:hypothetical protein
VRIRARSSRSAGPARRQSRGNLACVCARHRPPPPSPENVRLLLQKKRFTSSADDSQVAELYAKFFEKVTKVDELVFQGLEWGDDDVVELCEVLPHFKALTKLDLSENKIGPEGASALGKVLKVQSKLTDLNLIGNKIGANGANAIADALQSRLQSGMTRLTKLDLSGITSAKTISELKKLVPDVRYL